jgi:hypothetical protein
MTEGQSFDFPYWTKVQYTVQHPFDKEGSHAKKIQREVEESNEDS